MSTLPLERKRAITCAVIGDRGSGKSTFVSQAILKTKPRKHVQTNNCQKLQKDLFVEIDGFRSPVLLSLWDTPGSRRHRDHTCPLPDCVFLRNIDGVVITFDATKTSSFDSLRWWFDRIAPLCVDKQLRKERFPVIVVGTQMDMFVPSDEEILPPKKPRKKSQSVELTAPVFQREKVEEKTMETGCGARRSRKALLGLPSQSRDRLPSPRRISWDQFRALRTKVVEWCNERPHLDLFYYFGNLLDYRTIDEIMDLIVEQFTDELTPVTGAHTAAFVNTTKRARSFSQPIEMDEDETTLWSSDEDDPADDNIEYFAGVPMRPRSASDTIDRSHLMRGANRSVDADATVFAPLWMRDLARD